MKNIYNNNKATMGLVNRAGLVPKSTSLEKVHGKLQTMELGPRHGSAHTGSESGGGATHFHLLGTPSFQVFVCDK